MKLRFSQLRDHAFEICISIALILATNLTLGMAAAPAVGLMTASGSFTIDNSSIAGNATLFEGNQIETGRASSQLHLNNGATMQLAAESRGVVYRDRLVLERGSGRFENYGVEAMSLRIRPEGGNASAEVLVRKSSRSEPGLVQVAALNGPVRVTAANGVVLANVQAGRTLAFVPEMPAPTAATTITGCLESAGSRMLLTDETSLVRFDVVGAAAAKEVGHRVHIAGSVTPIPDSLSQVQAASVDAQQAASDEARFRRLMADGSVGAADHERQKARADATAARLDQARRQLELSRNREGYAALVAPYAGVVTAIRFERGQVVPEGQPVAALARDGDNEVVVDLPEDWVGRVRKLSATAAPWSDPKARLPLVLRELSPQASAQGRTYRARYAAATESRAQVSALPLGSTVQLTLSGPQAGPDTVSLPVSALVKASGSAGVWSLDGKGSGLVFTPVKVVAIDEASVRVSGLAAGSRVVSVGAQKLDAGITVRAIERPAEAATTETSKGRS